MEHISHDTFTSLLSGYSYVMYISSVTRFLFQMSSVHDLYVTWQWMLFYYSVGMMKKQQRICQFQQLMRFGNTYRILPRCYWFKAIKLVISHFYEVLIACSAPLVLFEPIVIIHSLQENYLTVIFKIPGSFPTFHGCINAGDDRSITNEVTLVDLCSIGQHQTTKTQRSENQLHNSWVGWWYHQHWCLMSR